MSSDTDFVDFVCPYCEQNLSFPTADPGKIKECPNCLERMVVPEALGMTAKRIPASIRTERLTLERFQVGDEEDLAGLLSDDANLRFSNCNPMSSEEAEAWISSEENQTRFPKTTETCHCSFAVKTDKLIGVARLWYFPTRFNETEFEIIIRRDWQRRGFASEAARGLLSHSFESLAVRRVETACDSRNVAGRKLLLKTGFRQESERIEDRLVKGEWVDTVGFAMLKREYLAMIACR